MFFFKVNEIVPGLVFVPGAVHSDDDDYILILSCTPYVAKSSKRMYRVLWLSSSSPGIHSSICYEFEIFFYFDRCVHDPLSRDASFFERNANSTD
jgi:hypothetical protein